MGGKELSFFVCWGRKGGGGARKVRNKKATGTQKKGKRFHHKKICVKKLGAGSLTQGDGRVRERALPARKAERKKVFFLPGVSFEKRSGNSSNLHLKEGDELLIIRRREKNVFSIEIALKKVVLRLGEST